MIEINTAIIDYSYSRDIYDIESKNNRASVIDPYFTKIMAGLFIDESGMRIKTNFEI